MKIYFSRGVNSFSRFCFTLCYIQVLVNTSLVTLRGNHHCVCDVLDIIYTEI